MDAELEMIASDTVDAAYKIYSKLGPGLLGLLINFGSALFKKGVKRTAN